ncbi:hypothetical protein F3Y22_tig00110940pilonHSYRG00351 [Hibiscus syriacus]|uniref:Uncharacterized protein n=1 Tax=Hibiscus syriacus TaxID=106335 RepID=A0A6A2ZD39_HIBSY|nr:uncharacterized protein LOC120147504 [Hibiscus syriacus]KAE8689319.1 hypothetical protein F3Y22_tig00110940pilonHSYRG00351 [Hibiscus syriacus]
MPPLDTTEEAMSGVGEDNINELKFSNRGFCCCCCMPSGSTVKSNWWQRIATDDSSSAASQNTSHKESRWIRGWKKVRQWSELVARSKLNSFVRRFIKNKNGNGDRGKFHYDYQSYSLNFDDGVDEDFFNRNFYSRYASSTVSAKSIMDFDKKGNY